jgi:hypothetical protein
MVETATTAGNYNPLYYGVVGLSTLVTSGQKAVYGMRLITSLWCSLFFAIAVALAHLLWPRRLPPVVVGVAVTPMCLFLAGSINPNAVEIATTLCAFVSAYAMFDRSFAHPRLAALVFGVSGFLLSNLRGLSIAWLVVVFVGALMLQWRRDLLPKSLRNIWIGLSLAVVGVAAGAVWQLVANSFQSLGGAGVKDTPDQVVSVMLERTFDYARQYVGVMGWLDTDLPTAAFVVWDGICGLLILGCLARWRGRRRIAVLLLAAVIFFLPSLLQLPAAPEVGYIWQGRYILPLVVVLLAVCGTAFDGLNMSESVGRNVFRFSLIGLAVVNSYGFLWVLRRYVTGIGKDIFWSDLFNSPQWQPPGGWLFLAGLYATVSCAAALACWKYVAPAHLLRDSSVTREWPASSSVAPTTSPEPAEVRRG